jgi:hypothetical protein
MSKKIGRPPTYKKPPIKKNLALPVDLDARIERHLIKHCDPRETFTSFCQRALRLLLASEGT